MNKGTGLKYLIVILIFCGFLSGSLLGYFLPLVKSSDAITRLSTAHGNVCTGMPLMMEEREIEADDECSDWSHLLLPAWISFDIFQTCRNQISEPVINAAGKFPASGVYTALYKQYKVYRI